MGFTSSALLFNIVCMLFSCSLMIMHKDLNGAEIKNTTMNVDNKRIGKTVFKDLLKLKNGTASSEQRLMRDLMKHYEKAVRPVFNSSKAVKVGLGLTLTQILDLDERNQILATNVWLEVEWLDESLKWSPDKYEGLANIRIPSSKLWLPDIVLYNSVDDYTSGYMHSLAMVYKDSRIFWGPVVRFRSSCKIDITYFPFDDQVCRLKLGSWAYNQYQVDVFNKSRTIDLTNYVDNGEWELVGYKIETNIVYYNCCVEPFPDVMFHFHLRRRTKYYFMNIIVPCIILSFLCLAGFLLPPESGEKITLGLSVLLTITVFMLMVADKMPQTSESVSLISIYFMVVLLISSLSVLTSVFVLRIYHHRDKSKRVPEWTRSVFFNVLAPVLCIQTTAGDTKKKLRHKNRKCSLRQRVASEEADLIHMESKYSCKADDSDSTSITERHSNGANIYNEYYASVLEALNALLRKQSREMDEFAYWTEWRDVAVIVDRILFIIFLFVTTVASISILEVRPKDVRL